MHSQDGDMSNRIRGAAATAACLIIVFGVQSAFAQSSDAGAPSARVMVGGVIENAPGNAPGNAGEDANESDASSGEPVANDFGEGLAIDPLPVHVDLDQLSGSGNGFLPPAHEQRGIGAANSMFSSRPADETDAGDGGLLDAINPGNGVVRVVGSLVGVIGLIVLLRKLMGRFGGSMSGGGRPSGVVQILARYPMGRGQQLIMLQVVRRILLIHQAGNTVTTLCEASDPEEVARWMARLEAGKRNPDDDFLATLNKAGAEHENDGRAAPRAPGSVISSDEAVETVDLTRGGIARWFRRVGGAA